MERCDTPSVGAQVSTKKEGALASCKPTCRSLQSGLQQPG